MPWERTGKTQEGELARPSRGPGQPAEPRHRRYQAWESPEACDPGWAGLPSRAVLVGRPAAAPAGAANGPYLATPGPATATMTTATAISSTDNPPTSSFGSGAATQTDSAQPTSVTARSNRTNGKGAGRSYRDAPASCPSSPDQSREGDRMTTAKHPRQATTGWLSRPAPSRP
jgi:hypothetical protein